MPLLELDLGETLMLRDFLLVFVGALIGWFTGWIVDQFKPSNICKCKHTEGLHGINYGCFKDGCPCRKYSPRGEVLTEDKDIAELRKIAGLK
jgi:hypothetical protein